MRFGGLLLAVALLWGCEQTSHDRLKQPTIPKKVPQPKSAISKLDVDKLKLWGKSADWRQPTRTAVAVGFYPRSVDMLTAQLKKYLKEAKPRRPEGEILGLVSPHAGYIYCWRTAAHGYRLLAGKKFDTIIILSTSHHSGRTSVCDVAYYQMPWGAVPVDRKAVKTLLDSGKFRYIPYAHTSEHGIETQLPFLCFLLKDFKIVPIVVGIDADGREKELAEALLKATEGKKVLVVISTDLTHYPDHETAESVEKEFLGVVESLDVAKIKETARQLVAANKKNGVNCVACGLEALCLGVEFLKAKGAKRFVVLHHADSYTNLLSLPEEERMGIRPKPEQVVGYVSAVFVGEK